MTDERAARRGGVLDWWYDGGKRRHLLDLDSPEGRAGYRQLAAAADLVVETERPGRLAELRIDHEQLLASNRRLCQVSITPFGRTGPWRDWLTSDLVSAALAGTLSVTGLADRPLNLWGRQAYNYAGYLAAQAALAAVTTEAVERVDEIMDTVRQWVRGYDARALWWEAQRRAATPTDCRITSPTRCIRRPTGSWR